MKRLKFKSPFNGKDKALTLIPESYKVDNKVFEMTDGNETYTVRWEGDAKGNAIVLRESNQLFINEDMQKIKHLMNYSSKETLGIVIGKARLDEDTVFNTTLNKAKMLKESEGKKEEPAEKKNLAEAEVKTEGCGKMEENSMEECGPTMKEEEKPSAGLTKKQKSNIVKKTTAGEHPVGKPGDWEKTVAAAEKSGATDPEAVAGAQFWKGAAKKYGKNESELKEELTPKDSQPYTTKIKWGDFKKGNMGAVPSGK